MSNHSIKDRAGNLFESFLMPKTVRTNRCDGLLRLIACLSMLIDHGGKMLFNNMLQMRVIGRLAFPLFAYCLAVGIVYTRDSKKYLTRLVQLALISQPLYAFGLAHTNPAMFAIPFTRNPLASAFTFYISSWQTPSILLSLCLAAGILIALRDRNYILAIGIYVLCELFGTNLDYGINGIRLILLFYCLLEHPILMATLGSAFVIQWAYHLGNARFVFFGVPFNMEIFAIPSVLLCAIPMTRFFRLPRWFTYLFYPAHLILLWVLSSLIRPH